MSFAALPFIVIYCIVTGLLAWYDYRTGLLPDRLVCPLLWCGMLFFVVIKPQQLPSSVLGAIAGYCSLAGLHWLYKGIRHKEGLGYGDVKFFAALGAWHGWQQLPVLITIATGSALLFVCLEAIIARSSQALKNPLRFGPFLSAAGVLIGFQTWWTTLPL
ncbi:A24 family peptidase [Scandinavium sp. TWS1a]|uniref:prepilin peptidase n=1 Tax=Scandinavium tedordense TaxID=2926521 RepID=UPI0013579664|nr:A24 family peptidase [Scandinavium tedordense]MCS2171213.1 A24 family peptidase [Scandinavium tedordense]